MKYSSPRSIKPERLYIRLSLTGYNMASTCVNICQGESNIFRNNLHKIFSQIQSRYQRSLNSYTIRLWPVETLGNVSLTNKGRDEDELYIHRVNIYNKINMKEVMLSNL